MESVPLKFGINSLSISPDSSSIICGGREILKIFSLSDFSEIRNLRIGKSNLNYATQDLAWHHLESDCILSAAKNSFIVLWNLKKPGGNKLENLYKGHSTVVNRVKWHPSLSDIFISAGQDGVLRVWDRRIMDSSISVFQCNSEGARDVSFSPHKENIIAASFDSGSVKILDWRMQQDLKQINAHKRSALTIDWHPLWSDTIASGGSDKSIKIWSSLTGEAIFKIQCPEPVARVKWLPTSSKMIASASHRHDDNLYVWDIENPVLPSFIYRGHSQPVRDLIFLKEDYLITCSDDGLIVKQPLANGYSPKNDRPKSLVSTSPLNVLASVTNKNNQDLLTFTNLGDMKTDIKKHAEKYVLKGDREKNCNINANVSENNKGIWKAIGMLSKIAEDSSNSWLSPLIDEALNETIEYHSEKGDIQTSACISTVLNLKGPLKEYSDLLRQFELTMQAAKLPINNSASEILLKCKCGKSIEDSICAKCENLADCSICGSVVKGLFSWCQGCGHGGHSQHISAWFKTSPFCPTGCGHACNG